MNGARKMSVISTSSLSSVQSSNRNTNYHRLACLLVEEGTKCLQNVVLKHLPERKTLEQVLAENEYKFRMLMKNRIITRVQFEALYPYTGDTSKIDIGLWLVLARNVTDKRHRKNINWSRSPTASETDWPHDLIRLRELRNYLFHVSAPELVDDKYTDAKYDLVSVLQRLGSPAEAIVDHLTRDLDPQRTQVSVLQIREQYLQEKVLLLKKAAKQKTLGCWQAVVLTLLALLVIVTTSLISAWYFKKAKRCSDSLKEIASDNGVFSFMPRPGWSPRPRRRPHELRTLNGTVSVVSIHHTASVRDACTTTEDCCTRVRRIQIAHLSRNWNDIGYNYLIGNDGVVYEGRGYQYQGSAVWSRNSEIISVALLGSFICAAPSDAAVITLYFFLDYITKHEPSAATNRPLLDRNYALYGHCQLNVVNEKHRVEFRDSPGAATMQKIMFWNHWNSLGLDKCDVDKDCLMASMCCRNPCNKTAP